MKLRKLLKTAGGLQIEPVNLLKQKMFGAKNKAVSYYNQRYRRQVHSNKNEKRYKRLFYLIIILNKKSQCKIPECETSMMVRQTDSYREQN